VYKLIEKLAVRMTGEMLALSFAHIAALPRAAYEDFHLELVRTLAEAVVKAGAEETQ
jgi:hypothetical protein